MTEVCLPHARRIHNPRPVVGLCDRRIDAGNLLEAPREWTVRENRWLASRYGTDASPTSGSSSSMPIARRSRRPGAVPPRSIAGECDVLLGSTHSFPPEPSIFISYRREDSAGHATLLLDKLKSWYGTRSLFLDHDAIEGGEAFSDALDDTLARADVTVVVIGSSWADVERAGRRRLDDPNDWVRREVATSLERTDVRVIPVLVGGAELPAASELPEELERLPELQAITVRADRIDDDVRLLIRAIGGSRRRVLGLSLRMWGVCGVVLALGLVGTLVAWPPDDRPPVISDHLRASIAQGQSVELDLLGVVSDDDPDSLSVVADEFSEHGGRVVAETPGFVLYTSPPDFHGVDRFDFVVTDGAGARAEGAAFITVALGPMVGDFNVAIAEFTEVRGEGVPAVTTRSSELARTVSDRIADDLGELNRSEGFNFGVRGPGDVGPVLGASELDRAAAASELSAEVGADVVLYGVATAEGFAPEFYLSDQDGHLEGAEELGGQYELGSRILGSILGTGSVTDNAVARRELTARIDALIDFVIGLSWIQSGEFVRAELAFQDADVPEWRDRDGKEILHLFMGTVAGNQGSPEDLDASGRSLSPGARTQSRLRTGPGWSRHRAVLPGEDRL